ncbi:hypothetical protein [Dactylosporangium sp. NPDC049140]|uniref:hypothetical protein n=1 Tax=Dactylosporangium sp. NPDC049140 TaxID=3155647 RepID=UPI0033E87589
MGASGWDYLVPFAGSVATTLERLRADVFAAGDYYTPRGEDHPKPATEEELWSDEWVQESMTHSILDVFEVGSGDPTGFEALGKTFEVTEAECERIFGTPRATPADLARGFDALEPLLTMRGVGRHVVGYADGRPDQVLFFGYSGD